MQVSVHMGIWLLEHNSFCKFVNVVYTLIIVTLIKTTTLIKLFQQPYFIEGMQKLPPPHPPFL